jgi:molybdopterin-binding protein
MSVDQRERGEPMKFSKLSTANQIEGKIMEIRKGAVTAVIYVQIAGDTMVEVSVTIASLETLGLYEGKGVTLIINPVDVMVGCE